MKIIPIALLLLFAIIVIIAKLLPANPSNQGMKFNLQRYYLRKSIVTPVEKWLYKILIDELPKEYIVAPKVGMKDFIGVSKGNNYKGHFWHIAQKHIDFLICKAEDLSPVMGIELDDSTHHRQDRQKRDIENNQIYNAIGLKVIHIPTKITEEALRNAIKQIFNCNETSEQ